MKGPCSVFTCKHLSLVFSPYLCGIFERCTPVGGSTAVGNTEPRSCVCINGSVHVIACLQTDVQYIDLWVAIESLYTDGMQVCGSLLSLAGGSTAVSFHADCSVS